MAGCGPKDIYDALIAVGASSVQAIGIMANGIAESNLNPETAAMDSNGHMSYGMQQWNTASYPNAASLVTGNCAADIKAQVKFLALTGGFTAASPDGAGTPAQAAGNFAANYERCKGCQAGSTYPNGWSTRVANAATVAAWASSGKWPSSAGSGGGGGGGGATLTADVTSDTGCLWQLGGAHIGLILGHGPSLPSYCVLSKSEVRAMIGGALMVGGALIALPGLFMLAAFSFRRSGAQQAAGQAGAVLEHTPGYGHAIRYARTRSENRAARAQGARTEQLRQQRAAGRKQQRAAGATGGSGVAQGQKKKGPQKGAGNRKAPGGP